MSYPFAYVETITESGLIFTGTGLWYGYLIGLDGANNKTITIYDNTSASGKIIKPSQELDATVKTENGVVLAVPIKCDNGLYVEITGAGTCTVTVLYNQRPKYY